MGFGGNPGPEEGVCGGSDPSLRRGQKAKRGEGREGRKREEKAAR